MCYADYEEKVVGKYGVELVNFPFTDKFDPSRMTLDECERLLTLLYDKICFWRRLTTEQTARTKEALAEKKNTGKGRVRKERSDKGQPRGSYKKRANVSGEPDNGADKENEGPRGPSGPPRKRRKAISSAVVDGETN